MFFYMYIGSYINNIYSLFMLPYLQKFTETIQDEIPGFKSVAVLNVKTGDIMISKIEDPSANIELVAPFYLEIYNQSKKNILLSNSNEDPIDQILITSEDEYHMIESSPEEKFITIVIVDIVKSNLMLAKTILTKHKSTIGKELDKNF